MNTYNLKPLITHSQKSLTSGTFKSPKARGSQRSEIFKNNKRSKSQHTKSYHRSDSVDDFSPCFSKVEETTGEAFAVLFEDKERMDLLQLSYTTSREGSNPSNASDSDALSMLEQEAPASEIKGRGELDSANELKEEQETQINDEIGATPCSKSSLEISLCQKEAKIIWKAVVDQLGYHEKGKDLERIFMELVKNKHSLTYSDFTGLFVSKNSDFYDYFYFRGVEKIIIEWIKKGRL